VRNAFGFAAPMINPDKCGVLHQVTIPSQEKPIGFRLERKCHYEDRCGGKTNNTQGNRFIFYWYFDIHDILLRHLINITIIIYILSCNILAL